jgi:peptidyl-prolyl cis-trans isomerase D
LANVRQLLGAPIVTPYDVFRAYRDQNERVAAKAVEVPADKFLAKVPVPSPQEIQAYFDRYKDVLPDLSRPTPGFKVPRQVQLEVLSIDGNALARGIKDQLSEAELRTAYENHKSEYQVTSELPTDLFAGQPELTPPLMRSFDEVRSTLAYSLAEEKAQVKIVDQFDAIKRNELFPFADRYHTALTDIEEAKNQGSKTNASLPEPTDLKELAKREHLNYELTPMLSREEAERFGPISAAEVGLTRLSGGRKFVEEFFDSKDPKANLFEPEELADLNGTRYLVRKIKDVPPRVPSLEEVRPQVSLAWKMERARPLAQKAAEQVADQLKKQGGAIKEGTIDGYRVLTIPPIARRQANLLPGRFEMPQPEDTPIPEVPHPGEAFRDAYFSLQNGSTKVAPNQPETVYYALTLDRREPATFAALYAPNGDEFRYKMVARDQAERDLVEHWMGWLRDQAGLPGDWLPPDEAKAESSGSKG